MKKIFVSHDIGLIGFYKTILEENGITTVIKNYYLTGGAGEIPANECIPELWIMNDAKFDEAKLLLTPKKNTPWQCICGEKISGEFFQCWKCGKMREMDN